MGSGRVAKLNVLRLIYRSSGGFRHSNGASLRPLTVGEAALILGVNKTRVRYLCQLGEIPAIKDGRTWIITDQRIEDFGRLDSVDAAVQTEPDVADALSRIESQDLLTDSWVPDILRHEDKLSNRENLLQVVKSRLADHLVDAATEIEIPKTPFFARTGQLLSLEDRIGYHATVGTFASKIESQLPGVVFSTRLAPAQSKRLTKNGVQQWKRWGKYVIATVKAGNPWLIKSDLAAYFDCVRHDTLFSELEQIGVGNETIKHLRSFLSSWSNFYGQGLPQGPDASRILGNFYLLPVDEVMLREGYKYSRYMDDIRIAGKSKVEVVQAMRRFGTECRRRGLFASPSKTKLLFGEEAENADTDDDIASAANLMDTRRHGEARKVLMGILERSFLADGHIDTRATKFSLWRLALLREEAVCQLVLDRLDDLSPVASVVADYLSGYVSRDLVRVGLCKYLEGPTNVRDDFLLTFLFAAMLEHGGVLPQPWIGHARRASQDKNKPKFLRIVAANVLVLGRVPSDLTWLRIEAAQEPDPELRRGYATALRRAGRLDAATATVLQLRSTDLARTVNYLNGTDTLPSLVRCYSRVPIRRNL